MENNKNMKINKAEDITAFANKHHMPMGTELILGMPGETLETWKDSMSKLYDYGFHTSLDIYSLQVIENAPMNTQRQMFGLETFPAHDMVVDCTSFEDKELGTSEEIQVIKGTDTMPQKDLVDAYKYTSQVIALHNSGISDLIAIYLNKKFDVTYRQFYEGVTEYLHDDFKTYVDILEDRLYNWHETGEFDGWVGDKEIRVYSWAIPYIIPMELHYNQKIPYFIDKVAEYVDKTWDIDPIILEDYKNYAVNRVKYWGNYIHEQKEFKTKTNLYDYTFTDAEELTFGDYTYTLDDQYYREYGDTIKEHTEYVLYGRQRRWHLHKVNKKDK